jgi:hypothetical protein
MPYQITLICRRPCAIRKSGSVMHQLFDDEEGNIPRAFSDDDRSLPYRLITLIADDESSAPQPGSPLSRPEPSHEEGQATRVVLVMGGFG